MKVTKRIQEFKEAFNMIDHNRFGQNINKLFLGEIWPNVTFLDHRDGFIDNEDLHDMLASLGKVIWYVQNIYLCQHWNSMTWTVSGPNRRIPGCDDERGTRPNQLHYVPHPLWRETSGSPFHISFSSCRFQSSSTYFRERILRRLSRMLLAALTRRMWD